MTNPDLMHQQSRMIAELRSDNNHLTAKLASARRDLAEAERLLKTLAAMKIPRICRPWIGSNLDQATMMADIWGALVDKLFTALDDARAFVARPASGELLALAEKPSSVAPMTQSPAAPALLSTAEENERLKAESKNWQETARQYCRNMEFYRDIVHQIGEQFGDAAKTSDDGSLQDSVLALKVPELATQLRSRLDAVVALCTAYEAEIARKDAALRDEQMEHNLLKELLSQPEIDDFQDGVLLEAAHQRQRWGDAHDRSKSAENWYWLVGYLAGKALRAAIEGNQPLAKHHTISAAATLFQWHKAIGGTANGVGRDDALAADGEGK